MALEKSPSVSPSTPQRKVKRKFENNTGTLRSPSSSVTLPLVDVIGKFTAEKEICILPETLANQELTIQDLCIELEEERNASSSAASEAMSMILRLQTEKAEFQMEARQFKRYAEEKIAHDQKEIEVLEETIYKREQEIRALSYEIHAYKHRLLSYGIVPLDLPDVLPIKCCGGRSLLAIEGVVREEKDGIGSFTQQEMELLREIAMNLSKYVEKSKNIEIRKPWFLGFSFFNLRFGVSFLLKAGLVFLCRKQVFGYLHNTRRNVQ